MLIKELFPVDVKDTVKSASVIHVSGAPALNRDEESFRMGVIEAIGGLKIEEVAASLQIPATIQKPQVITYNRYFKKELYGNYLVL